MLVRDDLLENYFEAGKFSRFLADGRVYLAHLPPEGDVQPPETLEEHTALVCDYAKALIDAHGLAPVMDRLVSGSCPKDTENKGRYASFMGRLLYRVFRYHDFGKVNRLFQHVKMGGQKADFLKVEHEFGSSHAPISAYMFLMHAFGDIMGEVDSGKDQMLLARASVALSYPILKHHAPDLECPLRAYEDMSKYPPLSGYLGLFEKQITADKLCVYHRLLSDVPQIFRQVEGQVNGSDTAQDQSLFQLVKLSFSLLTAADYLATTHYMSAWETMRADLGTLTRALKAKAVRNIRESKAYNRETFALLDGDYALTCPQDTGIGQLNTLRREMALEALTTLRAHPEQRLFYIEAPTGGGKTNMSMLVLGEMLCQDTEDRIKKVFYVFPFTTLITQTYKALKETLGLDESEIAELHGKAGLKDMGKGDEDDDYGKDRLNYLDYLFANYPVTLLSHIRFFDIIKSNRKETNYLLHKLANSVVVLDELQSYTPREWDKVIYWIERYAETFNIRFVLMSATLPKLGDLRHISEKVVPLIPDKRKYFQNPNFRDRVAFDFSLKAWPRPEREDKPDYLRRLADFLLERSEAYALTPEARGRCFTIAEFIFKKTASDFYRIVKEANPFFDEVFVLSGTILEPRRQEIIAHLKHRDNAGKKILLITTQVVEAGVDIDMDLGFKDTSLIDSDEQLAGRINRNVNKPRCKLYLFDCDDASVLYKNDDRFRMMRDKLGDKHADILRTKDFDTLYKEVFGSIDRWNAGEQTIGINDYRRAVERLDFRRAHEDFKLINQRNQMVYVPLDLPVGDKALDLRYFSEAELAFLSDCGRYRPDDACVSGEEVWGLYEELVRFESDDFVLRKVNMKRLQGIMSRFSFSLFAEAKDVRALKDAGNEERYGFIYLAHHAECYSAEGGLDSDALAEGNFI
ncbi:hypothetical protein FUAX_43550 (plasmid) [Fulvitalea axinellae]|uniref:CRISPR-associated helicase Cas3 n=1 Tax=Fulvitalea axinellae TaxID=1182444 RepID=A0AAU9CNP4_9BACT|nr:hypothetical protein FUAX_43550 [Fulvitalea axinellae]